MQLVEGKTLGQLLAAEGRLSTSRAVAHARTLALALDHAHGRGVLHRDLKPENVMITPSQRAVLIDFGLAHVLDDAPLTGRGMCIGSPSYLAPERLDGATHDVRADLYSLGVMLYEMLAGARPFAGANLAETLHLCRTRPARPLRAIRDDVSPQLEAVVVRALSKDPARRFQSAEDFVFALDDVPVQEELALVATSAARDEVATTLVNLPIVYERPGLIARIWAWLKFGRWRWRSV
jgi:serine/threonine-protein kinase